MGPPWRTAIDEPEATGFENSTRLAEDISLNQAETLWCSATVAIDAEVEYCASDAMVDGVVDVDVDVDVVGLTASEESDKAER